MEKNTLFFAYHYTPFICISIMLLLSFDAKSYTRRRFHCSFSLVYWTAVVQIVPLSKSTLSPKEDLQNEVETWRWCNWLSYSKR